MKDKISIWSIPLNPIGYVIRGGLVGILAGYVVSIFRMSIQQSINYVKTFLNVPMNILLCSFMQSSVSFWQPFSSAGY